MWLRDNTFYGTLWVLSIGVDAYLHNKETDSYGENRT